MSPKLIVLGAALAGLAIVLSILACVIETDATIGPNWWPMFVVATYALAPFPVVVLGTQGDPESGTTATYWAYFTTGWIFAASFGIPTILAHSSVIAAWNCVMVIPLSWDHSLSAGCNVTA